MWALLLLEAGISSSKSNDSAPDLSTGDLYCPPEPPPVGNVIQVDATQSADLDDIVVGAQIGDTILLADGTYDLQGDFLWFDVPNVTMRSASGNREAVIIDGGYQTNSIVNVATSFVTIADLTLKRAINHPVHVMSVSGTDTVGTRLYNLHIIDPGQQAVKVNPATAGKHPDFGELACSHLELTDDGRPFIWQINNSCYTGGIDAHQADGWIVRDNIFEGFWCEEGLSEHAVHFWKGSRDTIVERNMIRNNARGIGFGLGANDGGRTYPEDICLQVPYIGHYGGIIRNNFIFQGRDELRDSEAGFDCGICLAQACETNVIHNSVVATSTPFSSIEWRFANTTASIVNNLTSHNLMPRDGAQAALAGNLASAPLTLFLDGPGGDLHLLPGASVAIDQGLPLPPAIIDDDFDGDYRIGIPDIGADEQPIELSDHYYLPAGYK